MKRFVASAAAAALMIAQASSAAPAFAQMVAGTTGAGARVVPVTAPISLPAPSGAPALSQNLSVRGASLLLPVAQLNAATQAMPIAPRVASPAGAGTATSIFTTQPLSIAPVAGVALAQRPGVLTAKPAAPTSTVKAEASAGALERAAEGLKPEADRASFLSSFWNRSSKSAASDMETPAALEANPTAPQALRGRLSPAAARTPVKATHAAAASVPAAAFAAAASGVDFAKIAQAVQKAAEIPWVHISIPYALAILTLLVTKPIARLARRLMDRLAERAGWDAGTRLLARHAASWGTWIAGALVASQIAGVDPMLLAKSLGIGTLAMSLALKGFLGNLIQGIALLLGHPFDIGDRVRVDGVEYKVLTLTLREVHFTKDEGKTIEHYAYSELAAKPITIFKKYVAGRSFLRLRPELPSRPTMSRVLTFARVGGLATLALGAAASALALLHPLLIGTVPYLYALGVAVGAFFLSRWLGRLVERLAKARKWGPNETMVASMATSAATVLLGLASALRVAGVSWATLAASAGVTGIVFTIAATTLIENIIQAVTLMASQPFTLGDRIKISDAHQGTVVDVTLRYVVIKLDEPGEVYTMLPVSAFTKFEAPADAVKRRAP